jgi:hypothetical protein
MKSARRFLLAVFPLALTACAQLEPNTKPQTVKRGTIQTAERQCDLGDYKTYRPTPGDKKPFDGKSPKAPYDAVIPPTYDAPSQLPSYCSEDLGR